MAKAVPMVWSSAALASGWVDRSTTVNNAVNCFIAAGVNSRSTDWASMLKTTTGRAVESCSVIRVSLLDDPDRCTRVDPAGQVGRCEQLVDHDECRPLQPRLAAEQRSADPQLLRRQRRRAAVDRLPDAGEEPVVVSGD